MITGKLAGLSEALGKRASLDVPVEKVNRQQGDQDYVLVDDSEHDTDHQVGVEPI